MKNNLSSFTSEELEKQYKKRLISQKEYERILLIKERESLEKPKNWLKTVLKPSLTYLWQLKDGY